MHPSAPKISRRALIAAAGAIVAPALLAQPHDGSTSSFQQFRSSTPN